MTIGFDRVANNCAVCHVARYRVRLNRIIKKGADWVKARFEIESKA